MNQEQLEEIRRINFECFEQLNTAIIRALPEFIQHNYTDEIMFDELQPDLNLFQRIRGPIWIDYPTESDIQVNIYYSIKNSVKIMIQLEYDSIKFAYESRQSLVLGRLQRIADDDMTALDVLRKLTFNSYFNFSFIFQIVSEQLWLDIIEKSKQHVK